MQVSVCLVFIILPGPSSGAPPRAAVPGSGLAPTPRYNIHPYKESRPPGALIDRARSERHRSSLWTIEVLVPREPRRGGLQPEPDKEGHRNDKNWGIEPHPLHRTTANQNTQKKGERRGLHVGGGETRSPCLVVGCWNPACTLPWGRPSPSREIGQTH